MSEKDFCAVPNYSVIYSCFPFLRCFPLKIKSAKLIQRFHCFCFVLNNLFHECSFSCLSFIKKYDNVWPLEISIPQFTALFSRTVLSFLPAAPVFCLWCRPLLGAAPYDVLANLNAANLQGGRLPLESLGACDALLLEVAKATP